MKQVLTIVAKLQPTPEQASKMDATLQAFADACNYVNDNTDPKLTNKITLQALTYQTIKEKYALVANMAVRACARVGANRKTAKLKGKPVKKFAPTSRQIFQGQGFSPETCVERHKIYSPSSETGFATVVGAGETLSNLAQSQHQ